MSARKSHRVGADPSASGESAFDYDTLRLGIANELSNSVSSAAISVARLVGDLCDEIQSFLDQGSTYRDVARIFEDHGVDASSDSIRVALRRKSNTPRDRAKRKVLTSKPAAPEPLPQVERPLSPTIPAAEKISPGSDPEVGEDPQAGPAIEPLPAKSDAFSASAPTPAPMKLPTSQRPATQPTEAFAELPFSSAHEQVSDPTPPEVGRHLD